MKNTKKAIALVSAVAAAFTMFAGMTASAKTVTVLNETFESTVDGWGDKATWVAEKGDHSGVAYMAEVSDGTSATSKNLLNIVDVTPGTQYTISADIYSETAQGFNFYILTTWDSDVTNIVAGGGIDMVGGTGGWEHKELTVTISSDEAVLAKAANVLNLVIESGWGQPGGYYLDNVSITYDDGTAAEEKHATVNGLDAVTGSGAAVTGTVVTGTNADGTPNEADKSAYAVLNIEAGDYAVSAIQVNSRTAVSRNIASGSSVVIGAILSAYDENEGFNVLLTETPIQ